MTEETLTVKDIIKELDDGNITKSDAFRKLYSKGVQVREIAQMTGSHYSFVYGVIAGTFGTVRTTRSGPSRSDQFRELADQGFTPGEIAKKLNANYSFVHSVVKKHRLAQEQLDE